MTWWQNGEPMGLLRGLLSRRHDQPVFVAVALLAVTFFLVYPTADWYLRSIEFASPFRYYDFGAYRQGVTGWLDGGAIYVAEDGDYHGSFLYPPITLLLFAPFVRFPFEFADPPVVWVTVSFLVLWAGADRVVHALGGRPAWWERIALGPLLIGFQPLLLGLKLGQTAAMLAGLLCFACAALVAGERLRTSGPGGPRLSRLARLGSGALTAVTAVVKLPYATAGAHLLADRDRFLGAALTGAVVVAASLAIFGVETHRTFLDVLRWGMEGGQDPRSPRLWLTPYFRPFYLVADYSLHLRLAGAGGIAALTALAGRRGAHRLAFALGVVAIPLLAPRTYTYYFVAALPGVAVLLAHELGRYDGRPVVPVVGVLLLGVHSPGLGGMAHLAKAWELPTAWDPVLAAAQPGLWGCLVLVGLAAVRAAEAGEVWGSRWP